MASVLTNVKNNNGLFTEDHTLELVQYVKELNDLPNY